MEQPTIFSALFLTICVAGCSPASPAVATPAQTAIDPEAPGLPVPQSPGPSSSVASTLPTSEAPAAQMCTRKGCIDGLDIDMQPQVPRPGKYEVTVEAGSEKATCWVQFPYPACGTPATRCEGTLPMMAIESGCELPKQKQTFPKLQVGEAPQRIKWTVLRDGKNRSGKLLEDGLVPEYTENRPNGPGCPPVCKSGHLTGTWRETGDPPPP